MLSGRLPPAAELPPDAGPRELGPGHAYTTVMHGTQRGHGAHHHHHGAGSAQADRVIASVARTIVLSSAEAGDELTTVDDTLLVVDAANNTDDTGDAPDDRGAEREATAEAARGEAPASADAVENADGIESVDAIEHAEAIDGVEAAEGPELEGVEAGEAAAAEPGGPAAQAREPGLDAAGHAGGGGSGAAGSSAPEPVQRSAPAQALGATATATYAPIARILPPHPARRGKAAREPQWVRIAGIGLALAALLLVVAVLLGHSEPGPDDGRDDDRGAVDDRGR